MDGTPRCAEGVGVMIDLITSGADMLIGAGFAAERISINDRDVLIFENPTVLGFLFGYTDSSALVERWVSDSKRAIADHQLGACRAGPKAWNTYMVFLCTEPGDYRQSVAPAGIEEDSTGTRKIS